MNKFYSVQWYDAETGVCVRESYVEDHFRDEIPVAIIDRINNFEKVICNHPSQHDLLDIGFYEE